MKSVYAFTAAEELRYAEYVIVVEILKILQYGIAVDCVEFFQAEMAHTDLERANGFEEALLKCGADAHDLSCCLHLRTKDIRNGAELIKRKTREFCDDIIKARLYCGSTARNGYLLEQHADCYFCGHSCDRISAGL